MFRAPKTARSRRTLALAPVLVEQLLQIRSAQDEARKLLGSGYQDLDLVFCNRRVLAGGRDEARRAVQPLPHQLSAEQLVALWAYDVPRNSGNTGRRLPDPHGRT